MPALNLTLQYRHGIYCFDYRVVGILLVEKQLKKDERKIGKGCGAGGIRSFSPKLVTPNLKLIGSQIKL